MLRVLEKLLTFKPNKLDHQGLIGISHERFRFGREFGLDLDGGFADRSSDIAVLFVHGNKHNVTRFGAHYRLFDSLGWSYLFFDFPGYGTSSGTPTEAGVYAAARAAYSHLRYDRGFEPNNIVVYGLSMGGAVSIELLQEADARALVTESTFTNTWEMARHLYPALPVWRLLPNRFRNDQRLPSIKIPKLFVHGSLDPIVPIWMAHRLHAIASDPKRLLVIDGSNHVDCVDRASAEIHAAMRELVLA